MPKKNPQPLKIARRQFIGRLIWSQCVVQVVSLYQTLNRIQDTDKTQIILLGSNHFYVALTVIMVTHKKPA